MRTLRSTRAPSASASRAGWRASQRVAPEVQRAQEDGVVGIVHARVQDGAAGGVERRQRVDARHVGDDVELGLDVQRQDVGGVSSRAAQSRAARRPAARTAPEALVALQRQRLQGQPQPGGGGAGARALQADLPEVQVGLGEVRERRVVAIDAPPHRVGEEHRAAAVGLQAVLVRIDDDGVALGDRRVRLGRDERVVAAGQQREEAPVGAVGVQAHAVALAQRERLVDAIDGSQAGRAGGQHHGPDVAAGALRLHGVEIDAGLRRRVAPPCPVDAQQVAHARVGVVRSGAVHDSACRAGTSRAIHSASRLAIVPLEVRWPRPGEGSPNMTRSWSTTSTSRPAGPRPAVERVVVGIDERVRRQVAGHGHGVGRLRASGPT